MAVVEIAPINHIVIVDNQPRIAGKGLKIGFIVDWIINRGWTFEQVIEGYELTHAQIHAALSYYYDHKDAIDAWIADQKRLFEEIAEDPDIQTRRQNMRARYEEMKKAGLVKDDQDDTQGHD